VITYRWKEPSQYYGDNLGQRLGEALDLSYHWPSQLAANLAMASLLGQAGRIGYDNGHSDGRFAANCDDGYYAPSNAFPENQL
jgi:hypothetical protein